MQDLKQLSMPRPIRQGSALPCPLCQSVQSCLYHQDKRRDYYQCQQCCLVFVDPAQRLDKQQEKAEYDLHRNSADDLNYRRFLSRLFNPLYERLKAGDCGLDFGCGPGPVLSLMLQEAGYKTSVYDVFYFNHPEVLAQQYNFISATEVVEHLFEPGLMLEQLWGLLLSGGILAIMTKLVIDQQAFSQWHYKNDLTHVCFFSQATFLWLANKLGAEMEFIDKDVIILSKPYTLLP